MWAIDPASEDGWCEIDYEGKPPWLTVKVEFAQTKDGVRVGRVFIGRSDGDALSARDLRAVKFPPNWLLFSQARRLLPQETNPPALIPKRGTRIDDAHLALVLAKYREAQSVAPQAPIKWMRSQWEEVSDATMRRWVKRALLREEIHEAMLATERGEAVDLGSFAQYAEEEGL